MYNRELFCNLLDNCRVSKELITQLITKVPMNIVNNYDEEDISAKFDTLINKNKLNCSENFNCAPCPDRKICTLNNLCSPLNDINDKELNLIGYKENIIINCITGKANNITTNMPYVNYNEVFVSMPKTAILQAILYHFFVKDNLDMVRDISLKMVSDILGVSTCCVKRNNDLLQACNLIHVVPLGKNRYNIAICKTTPLYERKEKGGKGYITMTKEQFNRILNLSKEKIDENISCVNMIKSELRLLLNADVASNNNKGIGKLSMYRYNSIFPKYLQKSVKNKELLLMNSFFKHEKIDNNVILFDISKYKNKDVLVADLKYEIKSDLIDFIRKYDIMQVDTESSNNIETLRSFNNSAYNELEELINTNKNNKNEKEDFIQQSFSEILSDLVDLSVQYGRKAIKYVLLRIKTIYIDTANIQIENWGAFVRQQVSMCINIYGSMFPMAV